MNDFLTIESMRNDLIKESVDKIELLGIKYNIENTLEDNYRNINTSLTKLGIESLKISEWNIVNNPEESKELILENLIDIQQSISYGIKQFVTWLIKHIKKLIAWAKTSYPFYKRVYTSILAKLVNIRKDIEVDKHYIDEFIDKNKYVLCYLEMNPHKTAHEIVKISHEPFIYINSKTYPMGDLDLKEAAIMLGHYDGIINEMKNLYPEADIGIAGISVDQLSNTVKYNIFANYVNKFNNGYEFNTNIMMASKILTRTLKVNVNYTLSIDDCIKRIKDYIKDIDAIARAYVDMSGITESIEIYDRRIQHTSKKFDALAKVVKFDKSRIHMETSNTLFQISTCFINTFVNTDKLVQDFLKGYARLYIEQLERDKEV